MKDDGQTSVAEPVRPQRLPASRSVIAGVLMGLANLVPGISGGTMILVMGLYDEFISAVADTTRLRFTRRGVLLLLIIGGAAVIAVAALAGTIREAVTLHRAAMYSLFIGLTLGGVPLLVGMIREFSVRAVVGAACGLGLMVAIVATNRSTPDKDALRQTIAAGEFVIHANGPRDVAAGALGMSAMVMPGVSGAYMLLILDRYEPILASIDVVKEYVTSAGQEGDPAEAMKVIVPVGIGAVVGLVVLSNLLKWMLRCHPKPTLGLLLGILLGSVVGIWPFDAGSTRADYLIGPLLVVVGFATTWLLSRIGCDTSPAD